MNRILAQLSFGPCTYDQLRGKREIFEFEIQLTQALRTQRISIGLDRGNIVYKLRPAAPIDELLKPLKPTVKPARYKRKRIIEPKQTCIGCGGTFWTSSFPKNGSGMPGKRCYKCRYHRTSRYKIRKQLGLAKHAG